MQQDFVQRSDGEEEDDGSLTLSPVTISPDNQLLGWEGLALPLPVTFEHEGEDGLSVSLGDFVRHIHPYCMAICVENDDGEQILPEGGILLEVVDQAENGEPILAIPDMKLPLSLPSEQQSIESEQNVSDEAEEITSDSSEHIVVDDDDDDDVTITTAPVEISASAALDLCSKDEITSKKEKKKIKDKSPSRRKKKKKGKEKCQPEPVNRRVLRSGTVRKMLQDAPKKTEKWSVKEVKKAKVFEIPLTSVLAPHFDQPNKVNPCQTETRTDITNSPPHEIHKQIPCESPVLDTCLSNAGPEKSQPRYPPTTVSSQLPNEMQKGTVPALNNQEDSSAGSSAVLPSLSTDTPSPNLVTPVVAPPVNEALLYVAPAVPEPKPKSLSLEEYRRLRQQKKPAPVEKQDNNNSTKWPSLPELPKELPPIPCLPEPSPRDRRPSTQTAKKEVEEVKPAWQPRGPAAPPTPEALLVPPAYMVASSSKVSTSSHVAKSQQKLEPSKPPSPQIPEAPALKLAKSLPKNQHTNDQPEAPLVAQSYVYPGCSKQVCQFKSTPDGRSSLLGEKTGDGEKPQSASVKFTELTKSGPESTTGMIKLTAATVSASSAPHKTTVVFQKTPAVPAATSSHTPITSDSKCPKPTPTGTRLSPSPVDRTPESQILKAEPVVLETKENPSTALKPQRTKSPTQELIEAFTSEIGESDVD